MRRVGQLWYSSSALTVSLGRGGVGSAMIRDDLQHCVAERLGGPDGILILDGTCFLEKDTTSAGVQRQ